MVLAIGSCGPTLVLGVHRINKKSSSLCLKNRFYGPTSQFGPGLKTLYGREKRFPSKEMS